MSVKYFGSDALNKLIDLVKTALGLKADDSNVVHKTGDETVGGTKTFSDLTYHSRSNSDSPLYIKGSSDQSWIGFTSATGDTLSPFGYLGVKNDNKPYFYNQGAKRLALLDETMPYYYKYDGQTHNCNDWTSQGIYVDYDVTNAPVGGWVTIVTLLAGYPRQICYPFVSNTVYSRYKNSSTWSNWVTTSQIYTLTTGWITLENYTWIRSAGGMYYVSGGIDIGLSSGNTIISITIADWSTISANYVIQPYRSGGGLKIGLMSNTDSFNDNSALKFIVAYV